MEMLTTLRRCAENLADGVKRTYGMTLRVLTWRIPQIDRWGLWSPLGFFLACYFWWKLLPVYAGFAIAALAFAAVIMTVRADQLKAPEKVLWVGVGALLLIAELRVLYTERNTSDREQAAEQYRQQARFKATVEGFKQVIRDMPK